MGKTGTGAEKTEKQEMEIKPSCIVTFRPHDGYEGEYGFDWVRVGDYLLKSTGGGTKPAYITHEIMGRYLKEGTETGRSVLDTTSGARECSLCSRRTSCEILCAKDFCFDCSETATCKVCVDINAHSKRFKYDNSSVFSDRTKRGSQTKKLLRSFHRYTRGWKDNEIIINKLSKEIERELYSFTPKLTIFPNETITLKCLVYIKDKALPENLIWEHNDMFKLVFTTKENISTINNWQEFQFTLECKRNFSNKEHIKVSFKDNENIKYICGKLEVLPNKIKEIDVIKVRVTSQAHRAAGGFSSDDLKMLKNALKQGYVKFTDIEVDLNPTVDDPNWFNSYFDSHGRVTNNNALMLDLLNNLNNRLISQNLTTPIHPSFDETRIRNAQKIYSINETANGYGGYSIESQRACVLVTGHSPSTAPHELLHSLGLPHTFTVKEAAGLKTSDYTYFARKTENIMDYSHTEGIERRMLNHWQWKVINKEGVT